ncbi:MAG: hypothetical protein DHS20C14_17810 [Phycisphaeraceae bacterium]|nr:MAG: hypothetical protein DHS20C14_17810 [Phycisphaeraceae bacterium]
MTHALVIAVFVVLFAADGLGRGEPGAPSWHLAWIVGGFGVLALAAHLRILWCARMLERTGRGPWIARGERAGAAARMLAVVWHGIAVLGFDELGGLRGLFGPAPALGDALAVALPLGVFVSTLVSFYAVEHRVRSAFALHDAELGRPVRPVPTRAAFVWAGFRQQVLFIALPLGCIYAWGLAVTWAWARFGLPWEGTLGALAHLAGAVGVFVLIPPAMKWVLNAVRLREGEMRDRLVALGRAHGVRFRDVLVWRTGGSQVNGAVMGLIAPVRYVLLTDGLLTHLDEREVEAVMAHEVAHVRRRHLVWLGVSVIGTVSLVGTPIGWLAATLGGIGAGGVVAEVAGLGLTLAAALLALGYVSRRFEWQADAFAAQHLSGWLGRGEAPAIDAEAAGTMIRALRQVAHFNSIDPGKFGWRHGSIHTRIARLRGLVGRPADRLRIDREVGWVKLASAAAFVVGGVLVLIEAAIEVFVLAPAG